MNDADHALAQIDNIARRVRLEIERALAIAAVIEDGNSSRIKRLYQGTDAGHSLYLMHRVLVADMLMTLMRIFDERRGIASLPTAFKFLNRETARRALVDRERVRLRAHFGRDVLDMLDSLEQRWRSLKSDECGQRLARLKQVRDNHLAHAGLEALEHAPSYADLFEQLADTAPIVQGLGIISGTIVVSLDGPRGIWKERAAALWDAVATAQSVR